ncbi:MAG TPA: hypothetical protein VI564_06710 [Candidatus Nanoarchaeia archaeon]|nr:hypothetical protein [Candidatus Nanoarchaeia archaeon]
MAQFGIFQSEKKEIFTILGAITGIVATYRFTLVLGVITLICGLLAKYNKSKYWSWVIIIGIGEICYHFIVYFFY